MVIDGIALSAHGARTAPPFGDVTEVAMPVL